MTDTDVIRTEMAKVMTRANPTPEEALAESVGTE